MIAEKLDLLMNLTNTKNSDLGRAVSFDASYIGRIRSGKRGIPKHQSFIEPAAAYFARNLKEGYQKKAAQDLLCGGRPLPEDKGALTKLIVSFLLSDTLSESDSVGRFIKDLSNLQPAPVLPPMAENGNALRSDLLQKSGAECFYGNAGKRKAVELFRLCRPLMTVSRGREQGGIPLPPMNDRQETVYIASCVPYLPDPKDTAEREFIELIHLPEIQSLRTDGSRLIFPADGKLMEQQMSPGETVLFFEHVQKRLKKDPHFLIHFSGHFPSLIKQPLY